MVNNIRAIHRTLAEFVRETTRGAGDASNEGGGGV